MIQGSHVKRIVLVYGALATVVVLTGCYGSAQKAEKLEILLANEGPAPAKPEAATENDEGVNQWGLGHWGLAAGHFREAIKKDPKYATAYFNQGVALDKLGQHRAAAEAFRQAALLASDVPKIVESEILKRHKGM